MATADTIVHTLVSCHTGHVRILQYHGDDQLTLAVGEYRQQPDCHFQLEHGGQLFNVLFEIDNATEPLDSLRQQVHRQGEHYGERRASRSALRWARPEHVGQSPQVFEVDVT